MKKKHAYWYPQEMWANEEEFKKKISELKLARRQK